MAIKTASARSHVHHSAALRQEVGIPGHHGAVQDVPVPEPISLTGTDQAPLGIALNVRQFLGVEDGIVSFIGRDPRPREGPEQSQNGKAGQNGEGEP